MDSDDSLDLEEIVLDDSAKSNRQLDKTQNQIDPKTPAIVQKSK